jgi:HlyD family secretion protein
MESAQNHLTDLQSGAREQEVEAARARVNIAQVNYKKADEDYARSQKLYEEGAIAREELNQAAVNLELKKNQYQAELAQLNLLKAGNRPAQVASAAAEVKRSQAILQASQSMLDDLKIYSPRSGTVLSCNYEEGEFVTTGALLATVADLGRLWIKVYIPTDDLPAIKLGQRVSFTVSGDKTKYSGVITYIAAKGEFTPKTIQTQKERTNVVFAVKISIENPGGRLKPGMPADVVINRSNSND